MTRPVTLTLDVNGFTKDLREHPAAATYEIDRTDFGITTNIPLDGGGVMIGDTIQLFDEAEAILQQPADA